MARTGQVASSLAAVVVAYALYWLIVVPLIEPVLEERTIARATDEEIEAARNHINSRQRDIASYFPADSWELKNPAIWESDQTRLLFKNLRPLADGSVELKPCTLVFFSKNSGPDTAAPKQPIIMRAVEGAIVRFDEPIVLKSVDLSKRELVGGRLAGPIRIYRNASGPEAGDELEFTTRDVEMLLDRVWTPHPVQFRLGRNHGSGRELEILLSSAESTAGKRGIRASTMRTLQVKRDVKMQLELAGGALPPGAASRGQRASDSPIHITCQGAFQFEMQTHAASFHEDVDVVWPHGPGEADQLNCKVLTVVFDPSGAKSAPAAAAPAGGNAAQLSTLKVRVIQARGNPVTVRSPRQGIYARCRGIDYAPGVAGAPGSFLAIGPGIMQRNLPSDPNGTYDAVWAREFRFEPDGTQHVARLRGAATVRFAQMGKMTADEILCWLTPKNPSADDRVAGAPGDRWQLERVLAQVYQDKSAGGQGPVVIDSPQLHGTTDRLEAWVERPAAPSGAPVESTAKAPPERAHSPAAAQRQKPAQRFDVRGRRMQVKLASTGEQMTVSGVTVEDQAQLEELPSEQRGQRPLLARGNRLVVTAANTEETRVTVSGKPGHLEAGGITLDGQNIEMERKTSRLWIDGPGRMTMPVEQGLDGQPIARPGQLAVTWQGGMNFQANTVVFRQTVEAQSEYQFLATDKLEAVFSRPIDFANPTPSASQRPEDRPQVAHVRCYGPAFLKSREFDERGVQSSLNLVRASDLAIDRASGAIDARGPGSVTRVARGAPNVLEARGGAAPPAKNERPGDELTYLNVTFQDSIVGNLNRREVTFGNSTKTVHGPVNNWEATLNADSPGGLGPQGMVLEAKQLTVREMPAHGQRKRGWIELEAQGNVVGEGSGFTARGDRLTYSQEKDQLVLRGDGFSPAEFFQEDAAGGPRRESTANELTYWLGLRRLLVTGFKSFAVDTPKAPAKKPAGK
jgi:hypothetical protein